jgi:hypothetical protein
VPALTSPPARATAAAPLSRPGSPVHSCDGARLPRRAPQGRPAPGAHLAPGARAVPLGGASAVAVHARPRLARFGRLLCACQPSLHTPCQRCLPAAEGTCQPRFPTHALRMPEASVSTRRPRALDRRAYASRSPPPTRPLLRAPAPAFHGRPQALLAPYARPATKPAPRRSTAQPTCRLLCFAASSCGSASPRSPGGAGARSGLPAGLKTGACASAALPLFCHASAPLPPPPLGGGWAQYDGRAAAPSPSLAFSPGPVQCQAGAYMPRSAMNFIRSATRLAYPHSLSYHASTLTRLPITRVWDGTKMAEAGQPMTSVLTIASSS